MTGKKGSWMIVERRHGREQLERRSELEKMGKDFTEGNIFRLLLAFMTPFLLANLLTDLYNMVDMIVIGQFVGSTGTAAVTLGGKLLNLCTGVSIALSGGGQVFIAQQIGAKMEQKEISESIGTMFSALGILSCVLGVCCFLTSETILTLIKTPEQSFAAALWYFRITSIGMPLVFGYNAVSSVLRGMGDSRHPLLFIGIAALSNLILDLVFVICLHMGALGTALATVIGQGLAFFFAVVYLYRRREAFAFDFQPDSFRIRTDKLKIMMGIGVPMALQTLFIQGTQLIIIRFVNDLGLAATAAYGIVEKIISMTTIVTQSVRSAGGSIVGQNVGAGLYGRAEETLFVSLRITLGVSAVLAAVSLLAPEMIFGIFSRDSAVLAYAAPIMAVAAVSYFLSSVMGSYSIITTGTGNAKLSFLAGILDGVVCRLLFCYIFGIRLGWGVVGFYMGNSFARVGPILVHAGYFYSGAWRRAKRLVDGAGTSG